ncbi:hypothetical protein [Streptomyces broussonetiae]|uniref:hypothetical protein n=1 Tax=Streptomyces broussonetiae TaxID=2686304 RepID=UPI0018EED4E7
MQKVASRRFLSPVRVAGTTWLGSMSSSGTAVRSGAQQMGVDDGYGHALPCGDDLVLVLDGLDHRASGAGRPSGRGSTRQAGAVAFLAGDRASCIHGVLLPVDGGALTH